MKEQHIPVEAITKQTKYQHESPVASPMFGLRCEPIPLIPTKWDIRFLEMAEMVATWSRDPSTKVGAVAFNEDKVILGVGFNGFPRGVDDSPERYADREVKYKLVAHAEQNLIAQAANTGTSLKGASIAVSALHPCASCTKSIIQAGIKRVVTVAPDSEPRWAEESQVAQMMLKEAGVDVIIYKKELQ